MVAPLPLSDAKIVVELGPGTGVMTRALLDVVPADARVLAFEINPRFVKYLREDITDPRLEVIEAGAETAGDELRRRGYARVDAVLSSLGLGMMPDAVSREIMQGLVPFLDERSGFTQFQYLHGMRWCQSNGNGTKKVEFFDLRVFLGEYFGTVHRSTVWRNLPPAKVIYCQP
jgi:phospholipid N-methyltransferase